MLFCEILKKKNREVSKCYCYIVSARRWVLTNFGVPLAGHRGCSHGERGPR